VQNGLPLFYFKLVLFNLEVILISLSVDKEQFFNEGKSHESTHIAAHSLGVFNFIPQANQNAQL
jgi:hypothetical protein